jgi:protein disulfide-isomerase A4
LAPEYAKAATALLKHDPPVPLAKVDATAEQPLAAQYGIEGYPTLKVFRKGEVYDYEGPRDADGIVMYMQEQASPGWVPEVDNVLVLGMDNFTENVNTANLILVEFYAPWCGHCKQLAPEYKKAASDLLPDGILLAKVDATVEEDLAVRYEVTGYPTLLFFRKGVKFDYKGPRDRYGIVQYMREQMKPATIELQTASEIQKFITSEYGSVVAFFHEEEDSDLFAAYSEAANLARVGPVKFGFTRSAEAAKSFAMKPNRIVVVLAPKYKSDFERSMKVYDGPSNPSGEDLLKWAKQNARPILGERNSKNGPLLYDEYPVLVIYSHIKDYEGGLQYLMEKFLPVASEFHSRHGIVFGISDEDDFSRELELVGLGEWSEDIAVCLWQHKSVRYPMKEEVDPESLKEFLEDYVAGKLKPFYRSQKIPKKQKGPITVVVGDTLRDIAFDPTKNVLLEVYAPWCKHCQAFEPIFDKLGKKYKGVKDVVVAKIDGHSNDLPPEFDHEGFPYLFLIPAKEHVVPIKYTGKRDYDAIVEFVEEKLIRSSGKEEL